jgi:hypothetical protein
MVIVNINAWRFGRVLYIQTDSDNIGGYRENITGHHHPSPGAGSWPPGVVQWAQSTNTLRSRVMRTEEQRRRYRANRLAADKARRAELKAHLAAVESANATAMVKAQRKERARALNLDLVEDISEL